ncbi:MAG TPA: hypothetical protein VGL53_03835 [Bryobacteraceae bacterium]|jgi:uncharacterized membrane protein
MATCLNCRADTVAGRFCANCGTPSAVATAVAADLPENVACALCYSLWALTGVIFLVLEPYNRSKFVRFHAWQSIASSVLIFAGWFIVLAAASVLRILPWIGVPFAIVVLNLFGLIVTALWLILMYKAYRGGSLDLPIVSRFAQKQA